MRVVGQGELFATVGTAPAGPPAAGCDVELRDDGLSDLHRAILDFEQTAWATPGAKDQEVRRRFGMTPYRYHQVLWKLLNSAAALRYAPVVVNRLRRVRKSRTRQS